MGREGRSSEETGRWERQREEKAGVGDGEQRGEVGDWGGMSLRSPSWSESSIECSCEMTSSAACRLCASTMREKSPRDMPA